MKKLFIPFMLLVLTNMFAIDDSIGAREYKENCRSCHGTPYKGSIMLTTSEWSAAFANNYEKLKNLHLSNQKAMEVLNGKQFQISSKKLLEFLENNSLDSGRVRGCSGTSCG